MACVPKAAPLAAVALTTLLLFDSTAAAPKAPKGSLRAWTVVWNAVRSLWIAVKAVVWALRPVTCWSNCCSGWASIWSRAFTVDCTSMPLPAVMVAEFRMALTASCTADVELEVEDAVVPEVPRSWLSDGEELLSKLDRSELIELVLIPILLRRRGTDRKSTRLNSSHLGI